MQLRSTGPISGNTQSELLFALVTGMECLGYENLPFDETVAVGFATIPDGAKRALVVMESGVGANVQKSARWRADGVADPTAVEGMPIGDMTIFEIGGSENIAAFKTIGIDAGITHSLKISYFG